MINLSCVLFITILWLDTKKYIEEMWQLECKEGESSSEYVVNYNHQSEKPRMELWHDESFKECVTDPFLVPEYIYHIEQLMQEQICIQACAF